VIAPVVSIEWWQEHRAAVVTADVRFYLDGRSARAAYDTGHLPGAVFVDVARWLAGPASPAEGRHPLPDPQTFAAGMASVGIGDAGTVVAYDDSGGVIASRLVWMLRAIGYAAAVLDGGLAAYAGPRERAHPAVAPATFAAVPWPADRLADIEAATDRSSVVLDGREAERYRGEVEPIDPRAGHIPGARSLPVREHLAPDGQLLPLPVLRERLAAAGVHAGADVVSYCGSGITACHNLIVLEHAGLGTGRLYPGSWSQYSHDSERPAATGDAPG
jgi:thiosulfate/3-mercaptopyruvate sulfurtransferase